MDGILRPGGKMKGRDFPISVDPQVCVHAEDDRTRCILQGGRRGGVGGESREK